MRNTPSLGGALVLLLAVARLLPSQAPGEVGPPPRVLQIDREVVKPWKTGAHAANEAGFPRVWAGANWPTHYLALTSMSGPNEAWFLTGFPSMAALGQDAKNEDDAAALSDRLARVAAGDAALLSDMQGIVAVYEDSLSYPGTSNLPKMRYVRLITVHLRAGHESDFAGAVKLARVEREKVGGNLASWTTYRVTFGMPDPTYLVLMPMTSLGELDEHTALDTAHGGRGSHGDFATSVNAAPDAYVAIESNLFAFSPDMSYVSRDFAAGDSEFWSPKPSKAAHSPPAVRRDTTGRRKH